MKENFLAVAMTSAFAGAALAQSTVTAFGLIDVNAAGLRRDENSVGFEMGMRHAF